MEIMLNIAAEGTYMAIVGTNRLLNVQEIKKFGCFNVRYTLG